MVQQLEFMAFFIEMQLFGVHGIADDLAKLTIPEFSPKLAFVSKLQTSENSAPFIDFCPDITL